MFLPSLLTYHSKIKIELKWIFNRCSGRSLWQCKFGFQVNLTLKYTEQYTVYLITVHNLETMKINNILLYIYFVESISANFVEALYRYLPKYSIQNFESATIIKDLWLSSPLTLNCMAEKCCNLWLWWLTLSQLNYCLWRTPTAGEGLEDDMALALYS